MSLKFQSQNDGGMVSSESFWPQLKKAISSTSGFHSWTVEKGINLKSTETDIDEVIHAYLRQTLETLAY
ncbi:MAG: hypothetical protein AAGB01_05425 [Cyanobacteria bacterium P01_F01_bin.42]